MKINEGNYGEKLYAVTLGTGTAWTQTFEVYAYYEQKEKTIMTYQALMLAIARLIVQRAEAHGNTAEQERINAKLDRLYALKATMLEQGATL